MSFYSIYYNIMWLYIHKVNDFVLYQLKSAGLKSKNPYKQPNKFQPTQLATSECNLWEQDDFMLIILNISPKWNAMNPTILQNIQHFLHRPGHAISHYKKIFRFSAEIVHPKSWRYSTVLHRCLTFAYLYIYSHADIS